MVFLWSHYYSQKCAWQHYNCNDHLSHNCIDTIYKQSFVLTWKGLSWKAHQCVQSSSKSRNHLVGINSWSCSFSHLKRTVSQGTLALSSLVCRWTPPRDDFWSWLSYFDTDFSSAVWLLGREMNSKTKQNHPPQYFMKGEKNHNVLGCLSNSNRFSTWAESAVH